MNKLYRALALSIAIGLTGGCATSKQITAGRISGATKIQTVAVVAKGGLSGDMDTNVQNDLARRAVEIKAPLPAGTRQAPGIDAIVQYEDSWRWDVVMYLNSLTINMYEGQTGDLLVSGRWDNSALHGFQDPRDVIRELMDDMFAKLKGK